MGVGTRAGWLEKKRQEEEKKKTEKVFSLQSSTLSVPS